MELRGLSYQGPPIDDWPTLRSLPAEHRQLLQQVNGFIQFGGALHIRGACLAPAWHALSTVWTGEVALHRLYPAVTPADVPFGQGALGDQFLLRDHIVYRLAGETGELESLGCRLPAFLEAAQADTVEYLNLAPLIRFREEGGTLEPGQLLSVYPPFCTRESAEGKISLAPIPALERIAFLADFAAQIADLPEGQSFKFEIVD